MPPKAPARSGSKGGKEAVKPKKVTAQQLAMEEAENQAQRLFKQHEQLRVHREGVEKTKRDRALLDAAIDKERLRKEMKEYVSVWKEYIDEEKVAFLEHDKHQRWEHVPDASRLPDVESEREVNTYLSVWRDEEQEFAESHADNEIISSDVTAGGTMGVPSTRNIRFVRGEQGVPSSRRKRLIDDEMTVCMEAFELTKAIMLARDRCEAVAAMEVAAAPKSAERRQKALERIAFHGTNLRNVNAQVLAALDFVTINALSYYDVALDGTGVDRETLMRVLPEERPTFKYGLWVKVKEATRSFTSLLFPEIEVRLDPKSNSLPKLPKVLGLSKENVAVRALQFSFNPFAGFDMRGKEYYALDCTLKVDLLSFTHRPHTFGEWQLRSKAIGNESLQYEPYPPNNAESRSEDPAFRISFNVPHTIVIRQPSLLVGKWVAASGEWEPCSHIVFGATPGGNGAARSDSNARRATFTTGELAHFAVLQEKVFDAPYERWSLRPINYDQVVLTLEGRRRGDSSDRVFRILVENASCKLLSPDDAELQALRNGWCEPVTMFRMLAQAGFSFILHNEDSRFIANMVPKSAALEAKAYADLAQYCQFYSVASTRHNKYGEDKDMALFRISKKARAVDEEYNPYNFTELRNDQWHHIRYHTHSCVLSAFDEDEEAADLNVLAGHSSHFNLYSLMVPLDGEDAIRTQLANTNYLLRRCVQQILHLIRPLSWG